MGTKTVIAALVCVALATAGCATRVAGVAQPLGAGQDQPSGGAATTTSELGDPRTVDVCQFAPQDAFKAMAPKFKLDTSLTDYGSCYYSLVLADTATPPKVTGGYLLSVETETGLATPEDYLKRFQVSVTAKQQDGRTVYVGKGQKDVGCLRGITLSGGQAIVLEAKNSSSFPDADPCPTADAMATGALAVLKSGSLKHNPFPAGSVGDVDLCPTLASVASKALGTSVTPSPAGFYGCNWVSGAHNFVSVLLSSDEWPPQIKLGSPEPFQIGNRLAMATSIGNDKLASSYVQVQYTKSPFGKDEFEIVTVNLTIAGKSDVLPQAKQVADDVVKALDSRH
ncbi:hypothetical protein [Kutzneria sp. NPDC051319]|uniref:hypothetical protein n=1 Tax=Kutzneria sp. NPDC051319 TaxID=3155047 RepID=UPI00343978E6